MRRKVIHFNTKRRNKHLLLTAVAVLITGTTAYFALHGDGPVYAVMACTLVVATLLLAIMQVIRTITRPKTGLELDAEGIRFNGSKLGRKAGKIRWRDIQAVQTSTTDGKKQLLVKFFQTQTGMGRKGLPIHAKALDINFYEMETLVLHYYHRYHERKPIA